MFFLGFPVYRFEQNNPVSIQVSAFLYASLSVSLWAPFHKRSYYYQAAAAKDPDSAFFKRLDGFQPCEVNELKAGTHYFAVYGKLFSAALYVLIHYQVRSIEKSTIFQVIISSKVRVILQRLYVLNPFLLKRRGYGVWRQR